MATKPDPQYPKPTRESLVNDHAVPKGAGAVLQEEIALVLKNFFKRHAGCDTHHAEAIATQVVSHACSVERIRRTDRWQRGAIQSAKDKKANK